MKRETYKAIYSLFLRVTGIKMISALDRSDMRIKEIAKVVEVNKFRVTGLTQKLEQAEIVTRERTKDNSFNVSLTENGKNLAKSILSVLRAAEKFGKNSTDVSANTSANTTNTTTNSEVEYNATTTTTPQKDEIRTSEMGDKNRKQRDNPERNS